MTLEADFDVLRSEAIEASTHAYAPYSKFRVGAAAMVDDGEIVTGCNVENVSYGLSLCAECGILSSLFDSGGGRLVAISVVDGEGRHLTPCGRCRQLLLEVGGPELLIDSPDGPRRLDSLLPDAFSNEDLDASGVMAQTFDVVDVIKHKRDGKPLSTAQIRWFIDAYTHEKVADEQAAALLMAIVWRGMETGELNEWTAAMIESGERLDLSSIDMPTSDKHSTGGVGDKVSLILAPAAAACGVADPMLSGRGLGHTGGTLDKLEAIPGFRTDLSSQEMLKELHDVGCVICAASKSLAPADRKLYALRDVTGTVESIPLIASSIMSKKIAEGTDSLVLDVKVGTGAFMKRLEHARELAEQMVEIGNANGVKTRALLTDMSTPLGRTAGNALEVTESIESLEGGGPQDLNELTLALAQEMLDLTGVRADPEAVLRDGSARARFEEMVRAQGGNLDKPLPEASERREVTAPEAGYLVKLDAIHVGVAAWRLGAGRSRKEDPVSEVAGVVCLKKPGDPVEEGEPVLELHAASEDRFGPAQEALQGGIEIGPEAPEPTPLIIERIA